jgi:hypothetical protein
MANPEKTTFFRGSKQCMARIRTTQTTTMTTTCSRTTTSTKPRTRRFSKPEFIFLGWVWLCM